MQAATRAFRILVSPTFGGLKEDRDALQRNVFSASTRPWDKLDETFKRANLEQAHYIEILWAAGFVARKADGRQRDDSHKIHDCLGRCV